MPFLFYSSLLFKQLESTTRGLIEQLLKFNSVQPNCQSDDLVHCCGILVGYLRDNCKKACSCILCVYDNIVWYVDIWIFFSLQYWNYIEILIALDSRCTFLSKVKSTNIQIYLLIEWYMIEHTDSSFRNTVAVINKCFKGGCSHIFYICCCQEGTRACWTASSAAGRWKTSVNTCHLSTTSVAAPSIATSLLSNSECTLVKRSIVPSTGRTQFPICGLELASCQADIDSIAWLTVVSLFFVFLIKLRNIFGSSELTTCWWNFLYNSFVHLSWWMLVDVSTWPYQGIRVLFINECWIWICFKTSPQLLQ